MTSVVGVAAEAARGPFQADGERPHQQSQGPGEQGGKVARRQHQPGAVAAGGHARATRGGGKGMAEAESAGRRAELARRHPGQDGEPAGRRAGAALRLAVAVDWCCIIDFVVFVKGRGLC